MIRIKTLLLISLIFTSLIGREQPFGLDERTGEYLPGDVFVFNEDSVQTELSQLIDKPTLLSFVYYHCPALCPKLLEGIAELVNFSEAEPGRDYQVITISIDHQEGTSLARDTKEQYYELIDKPVNRYFWRFFTAGSVTVQKLTQAVGWEFRRAGDDFVHATSTILITPRGKISQYFYGTYFNYMHFDMSVEKAANEETMPTRLKNLKYCYNYRPEKNRNVTVLIVSFGVLMILVVVILFVIMVSKKQRKTDA
ncbi:MAG: SCO family protein [Bacteroidales bacterium]